MHRVVVLLIAAMFAAAVPASADHVQESDGFGVSFDHKTGNEWWVEVVVGGPDASSVQRVEARDTGGPWVALEKKSWGAYAASFHIEPGHDVRFRATDGDAQVVSCWFTHPQGMEQCDSEPPPPGDTTFDHTGGNEWWVQVDVSGTPNRVQAQDTDGPWTELEHKDWGAWAASFHIDPGHDVRFRAMVDGAWQASCWFTHPGGKTPDGGEVCGSGEAEEPPPPSGDFDAKFDPKPGNEWWVEVFVDANEPLAGVDARDDGGPWVALEKKSWGAWAKSFHVEDGSIIEFRATSKNGETDISGKYRWPDATPVGEEPPPEPSGVDVAFGPKAGNEWWVEAIVVGDGEPIQSVQGRAVGGSWHTMTYRDWGAWAASFHVPPGSDVEFRATTPNGMDRSDRFTWPDARPVGSQGAWPEEGSYARYDNTIQHAPGIMEQRDVDHVYHDAVWWSHTAGWFDHGDGPDHFDEWGRDGPVFCDTDVQPGDDAGCFGVEVKHTETEDTHQEGDPVTVATWYGEHIPDCNCNNDYAEWDRATGITIGYHNSGTTWRDRLLLDTDAPMQTV